MATVATIIVAMGRARRESAREEHTIMCEKGIRLDRRRELRRDATRAGAGLIVGVCAFLAACTSMVGPIPRVSTMRDGDGFKMLRPGASATVCGGEATSGSPGVIAQAIELLLSSDPEAEAVIDAVVSVRRSPFGRHCATVRGDVVRATRTVMLPMAGEHQHDAAPKEKP
jgi:hypothetical protein